MGGHLNSFGVVALLGYIPLVFALFALYPPRRAVLAAYLIGWLLLPMGGIVAPGKIELSKLTLPGWLIFLNIVIFDSPRLFKLRPHLVDLPAVVWVLWPMVSSMQNGLGAYDGLATINYNLKLWGLPYLVGRLYFSDLVGLRDLIVAFVIGGLLYMPLVLFEWRMSPILHLKVYGFVQHEFAQTRRDGGFRPMVFMQHGLALTMWMGTTALAALGLWLCKLRAPRLPVPWSIGALSLLVTVGLCRSLNSLGLTMVGAVVLLTIRYLKWPLLLILLTLVPPVYMMTRCSQEFTGQSIVELVRKYVNESRATSVQYRLDNERLFLSKAMKHPYVGWGGWDYFPVDPDTGKVLGTPDGLWIIAISKHGSIGVGALTASLILPALLLIWRCPRRALAHPIVMPATVMATVAVVHMIDCLANAMVNPMFMMAAAGVTGLCATRTTWKTAIAAVYRPQAAASASAAAAAAAATRPVAPRDLAGNTTNAGDRLPAMLPRTT
jgi:hypothetical protein